MSKITSLVWLAVVLMPLWGVAQGDTVFADKKGVILIRKPDVKAEVVLLMDYSVSLKKNEGPIKVSKNKNGNNGNSKNNQRGMSFIGDPDNKRPTGIEFPVPLEYDQLLADYMYNNFRDRLFIDLDKLYDSNMVVYYPPKNLPKTDTVRIVINVNKQGIYSYRYFSRMDSLKSSGKKAMEILTHVKSWYPAHILYYKQDKVVRKKRAHCSIVMTVVLTAKDPELELMFKEN